MVVRLLLQYFNPPFGMLAVSMLSFRVGLHSLVLVVWFLSMPIVAASQPSSAEDTMAKRAGDAYCTAPSSHRPASVSTTRTDSLSTPPAMTERSGL